MTPPEAAPMREDVNVAFAREVVEQIKEFAPALSHTTDARHHLDRAQLAIWGLLRAHTARPDAGDGIKALAALIPSNIGPLHPGNFADDIVVPVDMTAGEIRRARAALAAMREGVDQGIVANREAVALIDEINLRAESRQFWGIGQTLHAKLCTIRATLARAAALSRKEGTEA